MHRPCFVLLPLLLSACSLPSPATEVAPQRVIVAFTEPRPVDDARLLRELNEASGAKLDYLAAISTRSAVYLLHCGAADPQCKNALERLIHHVGIAHAEFDRREKIR